MTLSRQFPNSPMTLNRHNMKMAKLNYEKCPSVVVSETRKFEYNLTAEGTTGQQWHFLDSAPAQSRGRFRGEITINRGDLFQASDIEVRVIISSNNSADLENVHFHPTGSMLGLDYVVTEDKEVCTDVQVLVFLRPWPKRILDVLEIRSEVLDITFNDMLNWHVDDLVVHTSHGNHWSNSSHWTDPFTTQNVTVSSISGNVFGEYAAHGNFTFQNDCGNIGIILIPAYGRPFKLESISATTDTGTIHVVGEFDYWPVQPHTHTTNIYTRDGELYAYVPQGILTNLTSIRSIIMTRIKPFGTTHPYAPSTFITYSDSGYTYVRMEDPDPDPLGELYNPLLNITSKHYLGSGDFDLRHLYSWFGNVEAQVEHGPLTFGSTELEDFEVGEGFVKARRGKEGESQLDVRVGTGALDIQLGVPGKEWDM